MSHSQGHPLFLPKGSVRALLASFLVIGSIYAVITQVPNADVLYALCGTAITHYFNSRANASVP